jgi:hypothetical protein
LVAWYYSFGVCTARMDLDLTRPKWQKNRKKMAGGTSKKSSGVKLATPDTILRAHL